jgi:large subunit ribosomal protein L24
MKFSKLSKVKNMNFNKCLIKKGDLVIVRTGSDRGKKGIVSEFDRKRGLIKVFDVNLKTHFNKANEGGLKTEPSFISISNVMFFHEKSNKGIRLHRKKVENKYVRCNALGEEV